MSQALEPTLWHKLRFTPMRDVMRGNFSARLDVKGRIEAAGLPQQAKALIHRVVRRTRLWKMEKADVAGELIAHFTDGIDAGMPIDELIKSFGSERHAAKLIRRAKKRSRPLVWHGWRTVSWAVICGIASLVAFYLGYSIYFFTAKPTARVDYVAQINAHAQQVPPDQRAWPLYRKGLLAMGGPRPNPRARPGGRNWPAVVAWAQQHADAIELFRQGAEKPELGFLLNPDGSDSEPELWSGKSDDPVLIRARPRYINAVEVVSLWLAADSRIAQMKGDAHRLERDLASLLNMKNQVRADAFFQLGERGTSQGRALFEIAHALQDKPEMLSNLQLKRLAHLLSERHTAADLIDIEAQRPLFYDAIQRIYSDDGHGNGGMTSQAFELASHHSSFYRTAWLWPAMTLSEPSRRDVLRSYDQWIEIAKANLRQPYREANWRATDDLQQKLWDGTGLIPFFCTGEYAHERAEVYLAHRDGVVIGIALELYHRRHGQYPASLQMLAPELLPTIPTDRITGGPVKYQLVNGKPLVYSLGQDLDDDSGKIPVMSGKPDNWATVGWNIPKKHATDGDWVLYPATPPDDWDDD